VLAVAIAVTLLVTAVAEARQVSQDDLAEAEAARQAAAAELAEVREELVTAQELQDRLTATIESLTSRRAEVGENAATESSEVRARVARMYMAAGRSDALLAAIGDVGGFFLKLSYLGAVADRDLEAVNQFVLVLEDLVALRDQATRHLDDLAAEVGALELLAVSRSAALEDATERLGALRSEWAAQEAARKAALEAELRRQEEELARQAAAATTTTTTATTVPPSGDTTTTTVPGGFPTDDGGYEYDPSGGVEQWRPLLTEAFARWGLDQEKCGPNGCLGPHIDDALTIMWCESRGVPFVVNPASGTTGLFQHRPAFWPARVARTMAKPWAVLPADATPYNPAHNIEVAALLIWESRETLIGNLGFGRPWSDGPQPFGHWDSTSRYCADPPLVSP
jgi:peptidoglycan hydrolase CwlO-like protein